MNIKQSFITIFLLLIIGAPVAANSERFNTGESGVMLHGYDPVSYFQGKPKLGLSAHSARHKGEKYLFSSADNRSEFLWHPEKYEPSFGGFCAYGVRMGKKFDIDPQAYEIVDGKLFVMLNRSTLALWKEDLTANIDIAYKNWLVIIDTAPEQL